MSAVGELINPGKILTPEFLVLLLSLLIWTTFTPVFYFLKDYGKGIGISNPGWFFTLSTFTEIGIRLFAWFSFDQLDKRKLLAFSTVWLGLGSPAILCFRGDIPFSLLGLYMGVGWGVALPVSSGLVFDVSAQRFKALNTNLSMVMFQGGFSWGLWPGALSWCIGATRPSSPSALFSRLPGQLRR